MDGVAHLEVILGAAGFGTATSRDTPVTAVSRQCVPTIWANRRHAGQCSEPAGLSETGTRASRSPVVGDVPVVVSHRLSAFCKDADCRRSFQNALAVTRLR